MKWFIVFIMMCILIGCESNDNKVDGEQTKIKKVPAKVVVLPEYKIHDVVNQINGKKYADIIIPSFNTQINEDSLSIIAFEIIKKEGFDEASFYINEQAVKANFSSSYSEKHPEAFEKGYLGAITNGKYVRD